MSQRIQLKRTRGWRKPANCVVVRRPTVFGNPFTVKAAREAGYGEWVDGRRAKPEETERTLAEWCVSMFRQWVTGRGDPLVTGHKPELRAQLLARLHELRGKDVGCTCREGWPCHGDVLLELANRQDVTDAIRA